MANPNWWHCNTCQEVSVRPICRKCKTNYKDNQIPFDKFECIHCAFINPKKEVRFHENFVKDPNSSTLIYCYKCGMFDFKQILQEQNDLYGNAIRSGGLRNQLFHKCHNALCEVKILKEHRYCMDHEKIICKTCHFPSEIKSDNVCRFHDDYIIKELIKSKNQQNNKFLKMANLDVDEGSDDEKNDDENIKEIKRCPECLDLNIYKDKDLKCKKCKINFQKNEYNNCNDDICNICLYPMYIVRDKNQLYKNTKTLEDIKNGKFPHEDSKKEFYPVIMLPCDPKKPHKWHLECAYKLILINEKRGNKNQCWCRVSIPDIMAETIKKRYENLSVIVPDLFKKENKESYIKLWHLFDDTIRKIKDNLYTTLLGGQISCFPNSELIFIWNLDKAPIYLARFLILLIKNIDYLNIIFKLKKKIELPLKNKPLIQMFDNNQNELFTSYTFKEKKSIRKIKNIQLHSNDEYLIFNLTYGNENVIDIKHDIIESILFYKRKHKDKFKRKH